MNTQDNQRGGIVVFAIIGVLLAGLLAGGLYMSKQQARIARDNAGPAVAIDTAKDAEQAEESTPSPEEGEDEVSPAPTQTVAPKPDPSSPSSTQTGSSTQLPVSGPSSSALPSTGPVDTLLGIIVVTAITFMSYTFVRSGARLRRAALDS